MTQSRPSSLLFVLLQILSFLLPTVTAYTTLSNDSLRNLPSPGSDFDIHDGALLAPILVPRVPGTPGSTAVLNHFIQFFSTLPDWTVELQNSTAKTPATGDLDIPFVNLIAIRDPPWTSKGQVGRLTLVAHYDSKLSPAGFIGATDSAAPCAMLMHVARSIDAALTKKWGAMEAQGVGQGGFDEIEDERGVQLILLDGEEAFMSWTDTDSLYGARSLAETWEQTAHPALSTYHNALSSISLFLLLDLLGASNPSVPSYFKTTHWAYQQMAAIETRLRSLAQFKSSPNHPSKRSISSKNSKARGHAPRKEPFFLPEGDKPDQNFRNGFMVQDDHIPFMARGVDILHIIPTPFPRVWHQMEDDGEHLDLDTVEDWAMLVTGFAAEWLDLDGFFEPVTSTGTQEAERKVEYEKKKKRRKSVLSKTEL
ncbi:MAG: hypothetical protein M1827_002029 [Pycnora praestabilis]|nr:MAG: hypothetical protein M1827_002029 [Pycnora praestabilis]